MGRIIKKEPNGEVRKGTSFSPIKGRGLKTKIQKL